LSVSRLKQLDALCRLLTGDLPRRVDWMGVMALANETLVTPQIYSAARRAGTASRLPPEVGQFLHEVWTRNRERNRRLFVQLRQALAILNAAGFEPTLLKGAAFWATGGPPAEHDRILTDLDLIVAEPHTEAAMQALQDRGFDLLRRYEDISSHVIALLGRESDVGVIDLHRRPPGPPDLVGAAMAVPDQSVALTWDGVRARAPSPALQVFLMVLHDQYEDGGYWRGEFALRHLMEIAALSRRPGGVDWRVVDGLARTRLVRNATHAELHAAATMFGALTPRNTRRCWVRLQHARRLAQFAWPRLNAAFRLLSA
jgi:hypothetical protein